MEHSVDPPFFAQPKGLRRVGVACFGSRFSYSEHWQRDQGPNKQYNRDFPSADCPSSYRPRADCQSRVYETRGKEASPTCAQAWL